MLYYYCFCLYSVHTPTMYVLLPINRYFTYKSSLHLFSAARFVFVKRWVPRQAVSGVFDSVGLTNLFDARVAMVEAHCEQDCYG